MPALPGRASSGRSKPFALTTLAATSQTLIPANEARSMWFVQAPRESVLYLNVAGGPAGPNLPGAVMIEPGQTARSGDWTETDAVNVWCAAAGEVVTGYEA